jgi:hypothetical protein
MLHKCTKLGEVLVSSCEVSLVKFGEKAAFFACLLC